MHCILCPLVKTNILCCLFIPCESNNIAHMINKEFKILLVISVMGSHLYTQCKKFASLKIPHNITVVNTLLDVQIYLWIQNL